MLVFFVILICSLGFSLPSLAAAPGITYHGRILKPDDTPVTAASVQFEIQIRTPGAEDCLMYEETQTKNLSSTNGIFSITIDDGSATIPNTEPFTLSEIFKNSGTFTFGAGKCAGATSYSPNITDGRRMVVKFNDGSGWQTLPAQSINFVPMALESESVGGKTPASFLRVAPSAESSNTTDLTTANLSEFWDLINGTSSSYMKSSSSNGASLPSLSTAPGSPSAGTIWYDSATNKVKYFDGTNTQTVGTSGGSVTGITVGSGLVDGSGNTGTTITTSGTIKMPDVGATGSYYKVTTDAQGRVTSGSTSLAESDLPTISTAGKVSGGAITSGTIGGSTAISTSGAITTTGDISGKNITASGNVTVSGNITNNGDGSTTGVIYGAALQTRRLLLYDDDTNTAVLKTPTNLAANYVLTLPADDGASGQVLSTDGAGNLSWANSVAGTVTSVSGTTPIQVATGTTTPVISVNAATTSSSGVVTLASDGGTTASTVVQANDSRLSSISGKLSSTLSDGKIFVGNSSNVATGVTPSGDVSISDSGATKVLAIQNTEVDATAPTAASQVLKYDGTSKYLSGYFGIGDLKNSSGSQQFPSSCSASQTMTWSAVTDVFACTNIGIAASQVTSGTIDVARLGTGSADSTTFLRGDGAWATPAGGTSQWTTSGSDIYYDTGNVAIGTTTLNPISFPAADSIFDLASASGQAVNELISNRTDADGASIGQIRAVNLTNTGSTNQSIAMIGFISDGTTGSARGGAIQFATKADNSSGVTEHMRIDNEGYVGIGTNAPKSALDISATGDASALIVPRDTTANQPSTAINGMIRYNTTDNKFEFYQNGAWVNYGTGSGSGDNLGDHTATQDLNMNGHSIISGDSLTVSGNITADTNTFFVDSANNRVGIGTVSPVQTLEVNGTIKTLAIEYSSDRNLKQNIIPLRDPLDKILRLRPVSYEWRRNEYPERNFPMGRQYGLIAQEVAKIFPELVQGPEGNMAVEYFGLISPMIGAIQANNRMCSASAHQLDEIEARMQANERDIASIKNDVRQLKEIVSKQERIIEMQQKRIDSFLKKSAGP